MKRKIINFLTRKLYSGLSPLDFPNIEMLKGQERQAYVMLASEVAKNLTWQTEINRLIYQQERKIVNSVNTQEELMFARGSLYSLQLLKKRFEQIADLEKKQV
jgi:hypothetical protein